MEKNPKIPKTGKIGSLAKNIEKATNRDIVQVIMLDVAQFKLASRRAEKAEWIKEAIERLARQVGEEKSVIIMENCGRDCCGSKHSEHAKQLMNESKSVEEFASKLSRGGVKFKLKDENTVVGDYSKCYCSLVNQTPKPFSSKIYCQCGVGYIKQQFESAFGKTVDVELVQSVISGAESCKFLIRF
ncbi:hypothetical protein C5S31_03175 [ANME-1 cluster archaeon GoMg2]|nr:hypothetical protein [ANME-1 cluster archaeon GoMg2]